METTEKKTNRFGLLGRNISYSFSQGYFTQKFKDLGLNGYSYENFDIQRIEELESVLSQSHIKGLNVTIPYKEEVIPFLDELDAKAGKIGAVNTIKITEKGLKGFNTDAYGFQKSLEPFLKSHHTKALILGTGGASKAVRFVLDELGIANTYVSRHKKASQFSYDELDREVIEGHTLIINCTPLGTYPNIAEKPNIPYQFLNKDHLLYDLIYNPEKTTFLALGEASGASICNGLQMLKLQAEKAWEIWNTP
ncbi:shikimate dehydrogenase family protein [Flagellimonas aequoris]|uniref:Shikimate dehydrogenase n=1 Tax=Flagellimonas aequoris TaxID=2306997 RepID=A0A418N5W2_9FLAO|nr:shikimate dehydrogenase [Allomuricauda aequoris]RIV69821.1 shikimate dehydrogenase [Allomuricauda aequoris]TXK01404.1 shikimate dehydrogenase [Allomuricauda aequoris]